MKSVKSIPSAGENVESQPRNVISGVPLYDNGGDGQNRFVVNGYQDVWAAILFVVSVVCIITWSMLNMSIGLPETSTDSTPATPPPYAAPPTPNPSPSAPPPNGNTVLVGIIACLGSLLGGAAIILWLLHQHPKSMIIAFNIGQGIVLILLGLFDTVQSNSSGGWVTILLGACQLVWFAFVYNRVEYSAALLKYSTKLLLQYKAVIVVALGSVCCIVVYVFFWALAILPTIIRINSAPQADGKSSDSSGLIAVVFLFGLLCLYWTQQVASSTVHTATAGVGATWYFCGENMPANPTLKSTRRALTTSFGSICFGSLLIAIIRVMHTMAKSLRRGNNHFVACIMECLLSCLLALMRIFNHYAFTYIAIYGCGYIDAAKRTWDLTRRCAATVLFTDCIVGTTLNFISLAFAVIIGTLWAIIVRDAAIGFIAALLSLVVTLPLFSAINSFLSALLVCYADVPEALARSSPELYELLQVADGAAPQAQNAV